jgi:predicted transcriptional regulator
MTVHLAPELEQKLQHFAAQAERTPDELAREAVENYIHYKERYVAAVHEGIAAADRGELHDHDEVMAMMDEIIANG